MILSFSIPHPCTFLSQNSESAIHNLAMVQFVLSCLPESAKVILEDPDEKQHVRVLLLSMKKEVDALKRHRALPSDIITPGLLAEMAMLQSDTDGVASTLKRGWS